MKNLENFNKSLEKFNQFENFDIENDVKETEKLFTSCIIEASREKVKPDSLVGQDIVNGGNFLRRIGSKFLNLFKIEFTITFAGVTLVHLEIPKIDNNLQIRK